MRAPTAIVTDKTVGIATGMAATVSTRANWRVVAMLSPRNRAAARINGTRATATMMRKSPIFKTARWKWLAMTVPSTSRAVVPK